MNDKAIQTLKHAGWSEDRNIDISKYEQAYKDEGIVLFEPTKAFLRKFGGLLIPYHDDCFNRDERLGFHAEEVVCGYGRCQEERNPIGQCFHDHELAMDEQGRVWLYYSHKEPDVFAETGEEAINRILNWNRDELGKPPFCAKIMKAKSEYIRSEYITEFINLWEEVVRQVYLKEPGKGNALKIATDGWNGTNMSPLSYVVFVADPKNLTNMILRGQKAREKRWTKWLEMKQNDSLE
jgi:hypothetical protein